MKKRKKRGMILASIGWWGVITAGLLYLLGGVLCPPLFLAYGILVGIVVWAGGSCLDVYDSKEEES